MEQALQTQRAHTLQLLLASAGGGERECADEVLELI
jgi:hypothetical protein